MLQVYLISETNLEPTKVATKQCLHKKMVTKKMTCNVPTCIHTASVKESMCSLVPVIVCKVGNLAEMNFTTGAGKADMKWTSSNIQVNRPTCPTWQ